MNTQEMTDFYIELSKTPAPFVDLEFTSNLDDVIAKAEAQYEQNKLFVIIVKDRSFPSDEDRPSYAAYSDRAYLSEEIDAISGILPTGCIQDMIMTWVFRLAMYGFKDGEWQVIAKCEHYDMLMETRLRQEVKTW